MTGACQPCVSLGVLSSFSAISVAADGRALTCVSLQSHYGSGPSCQHEFDGHFEDLLPAAAQGGG